MADTKKDKTPSPGSGEAQGAENNTGANGGAPQAQGAEPGSAAPPAVPAPTTLAEPPKQTFKEKLAAVVPEEGNINVFDPNSGYVAKNNFVHGYEGSRYINLRNIDPELAEQLAEDPKCAFLEKKKEEKAR